MPAHLRPTVRAYYAFARAADDVADSDALTVIQKLSALEAFEAALHAGVPGPTVAHAASQALRDRGLPLTLASDLLVAFRADARNGGIKTLADLMDYCRHSAAPVGRFLLALHGAQTGTPESDALCAALQILNHVQDAHADADKLKRCYIPQEWLHAERIEVIDLLDPNNLTGAVPGYAPIRDDYVHEGSEAAAAKAQPVDPVAVNRCLQRMLDQAEHLLVLAAPLPSEVNHRGLAAQSAMILALANRLLMLLRRNNAWVQRISLRPIDWLVAGLVGLRVRVLGP